MGGPLSYLTTRGIPSDEKMRSIFGITDSLAVDRTTSISRKCKYSSMITSKYSLLGHGRLKSPDSVSQGPRSN